MLVLVDANQKLTLKTLSNSENTAGKVLMEMPNNCNVSEFQECYCKFMETYSKSKSRKLGMFSYWDELKLVAYMNIFSTKNSIIPPLHKKPSIRRSGSIMSKISMVSSKSKITIDSMFQKATNKFRGPKSERPPSLRVADKPPTPVGIGSMFSNPLRQSNTDSINALCKLVEKIALRHQNRSNVAHNSCASIILANQITLCKFEFDLVIDKRKKDSKQLFDKEPLPALLTGIQDYLKRNRNTVFEAKLKGEIIAAAEEFTSDQELLPNLLLIMKSVGKNKCVAYHSLFNALGWYYFLIQLVR